MNGGTMKLPRTAWPWLLAGATLVGWAGTARADDVIIEERRPPVVIDEHRRPPEPAYHYIYYPQAEVYFEPGRRVYWWKKHGEWRSGTAPPKGIRLRGEVTLDVAEPDPWRHHEIIVQKYPKHKDRDDD